MKENTDQGAKFVAVQDDALQVGVDDYWAYVSMRPDGPFNGIGNSLCEPC